MQMNKLIDKYFYQIFQIFVLIIFLAPFLAPIFAEVGLGTFSKVIYFVYSFSCHQLAHRSIHLFDYQMAWCTRDTFVWGGILLTTFLVPKFKIRTFRIYWVIPFIIPMALDGSIQTIATMLGFSGGDNFYTSTNLMRAMTGGMFGIGMGLFLSNLMYSLREELEDEDVKQRNLKILKITGTVFTLLFVFYLFLVQVWSITSSNTEPENILDLAVRTPYGDEAWIRQSNGLCSPETPKTILSGGGMSDFIFTPGDCF